MYYSAEWSRMNNIVSEDEMYILATVCSSLVTLVGSSSSDSLGIH